VSHRAASTKRRSAAPLVNQMAGRFLFQGKLDMAHVAYRTSVLHRTCRTDPTREYIHFQYNHEAPVAHRAPGKGPEAANH
jgi:hypothetical protein